MPEMRVPERVAAVRRFNRFYTKQMGLLHEHLLRSPFSLTQARVLYELAHRTETTATELGRELGLDPGYLSRLVRGFEKRGLITRKTSQADGRQSILRLTDPGRQAFARLNADSHRDIGRLLRNLSETQQGRLVLAMHTVEELLGGPSEQRVPYILRPHRPGDMGWVVHRHGALYAQEYGWDETFEALVAEIVARFIRNFEPRRERCWIAERDGEIVGSVFLVTRSQTVAQLRLLLVEPTARGLGIGVRLVDECIRFARQTGYRKMRLWTQSNLHAARHIYQRAGFRLVHQAKHHSFGADLVEQDWELAL